MKSQIELLLRRTGGFPFVFGWSCIAIAAIRDALELMIDACSMVNASIVGTNQMTLFQKDAESMKRPFQPNRNK
ncbi:MAG TPA: hypothetical protein VHZ09_06975 [Acidobacteriaceae bacterium]|nr:hypothetical protein [Acidobacteriaceae bacterium]